MVNILGVCCYKRECLHQLLGSPAHREERDGAAHKRQKQKLGGTFVSMFNVMKEVLQVVD